MEWIVIPDPHAPPLSESDLKQEVQAALANRSALASRIDERIAAYAQ